MPEDPRYMRAYRYASVMEFNQVSCFCNAGKDDGLKLMHKRTCHTGVNFENGELKKIE